MLISEKIHLRRFGKRPVGAIDPAKNNNRYYVYQRHSYSPWNESNHPPTEQLENIPGKKNRHYNVK